MLSVGALAADEQPVSLRQVYYRYIPAESFERISEFFDGVENTGRRKILRSDNESRAGFYYILRIRPDWNVLAQGSILRVRYIPVGQVQPLTYDFELKDQLREWRGEVFFGLTGKQWQGKSEQPIAWKLELLDNTGKVLVSKQSMLWRTEK